MSGGVLRGIEAIRLKSEWVILAAFVVQGVARGRLLGTVASSYALIVWVAVSCLLVILLAVNHERRGALVAVAGVLINLDVVLLNVGMPVLVEASSRALTAIAGSGGFYQLASSGTVAPWAGDALALRFMNQAEFLSPGDVLLAVGVAVMVAAAMLDFDPTT